MKALEMWLHKHHWLRKQSTGYEVSLHQTTVVVQVGILTLIKLEVFLPSEHYVYLEDGYCNLHGTRIRSMEKVYLYNVVKYGMFEYRYEPQATPRASPKGTKKFTYAN
ncbi:hypothetical protein T4A_2377 [Trichinella pseudospiralis]|uniref:Uncharacterized protein n=1 Tax=Trichinella pseudospiralis TaxID=6337 RepID=A0A0V1EBM2_TRIPS|nr:hypothetical protein T4A_2377 [Trichinella pseudospiralis]